MNSLQPETVISDLWKDHLHHFTLMSGDVKAFDKRGVDKGMLDVITIGNDAHWFKTEVCMTAVRLHTKLADKRNTFAPCSTDLHRYRDAILVQSPPNKQHPKVDQSFISDTWHWVTENIQTTLPSWWPMNLNSLLIYCLFRWPNSNRTAQLQVRDASLPHAYLLAQLYKQPKQNEDRCWKRRSANPKNCHRRQVRTD